MSYASIKQAKKSAYANITLRRLQKYEVAVIDQTNIKGISKSPNICSCLFLVVPGLTNTWLLQSVLGYVFSLDDKDDSLSLVLLLSLTGLPNAEVAQTYRQNQTKKIPEKKIILGLWPWNDFILNDLAWHCRSNCQLLIDRKQEQSGENRLLGTRICYQRVSLFYV